MKIFLLDHLISFDPGTVIPADLRRYNFVAQFRNAEIVTDFMLWSSLLRDPQSGYWLVVEAGKEFLPKPHRRSSRLKMRRNFNLVEQALLRGAQLGPERLAWCARPISRKLCIRWLELKLASII